MLTSDLTLKIGDYGDSRTMFKVRHCLHHNLTNISASHSFPPLSDLHSAIFSPPSAFTILLHIYLDLPTSHLSPTLTRTLPNPIPLITHAVP